MIDNAPFSIPSRHLLLGALRAGAALGSGTDAASAAESFLRLPTEGLFGRTDLERGAALLEQLGLVTSGGAQISPDRRLLALLALDEEKACELLLALVIEQTDPLWLQVAAARDGTLAEELVPEEAKQVIRSVIPDPEAREALLLSLANKFDTVDQAKRADQGLKGEEFVVAACSSELASRGRHDLAARVRHVSLISDQLGYDVVTPSLAGNDLRLEVKTTRHAGSSDASIFLSRNEARSGLHDRRWRLVICSITAAGELAIVGSCEHSALASMLPMDDERSEWMSCRLRLPREVLSPGLAVLCEGGS